MAIGPATKLIQYAQDSGKTYVGSFRLGLKSDTEDITGQVEEIPTAREITESELALALGNFIGEILQVPPQFSAVKVNGQRAYKSARKGETVDIKARPARIDSIKLKAFEFPDFQIEIQCGKGTYVRTLGRDIAKSLGSDSVMTALQRTAVGNFSIESSYTLDDIENRSIEKLMSQPSALVANLPKVLLSDDDIERLLHGKKLSSSSFDPGLTEIAAFNTSQQLLAILEKKSSTEVGSKINFVPQLYSK